MAAEENIKASKATVQAKGSVQTASPREALCARHIMDKDFPFIEISQMISEAYEQMKTNNLDCLPVVNQGRVERVITRNNISVIRSPFFDAPGQEERVTRLMCLTLTNVNQDQKLVSVKADSPLKDVMQTLCDHNIHSVPVLGDQEELLGMITTHMILEHYSNTPL